MPGQRAGVPATLHEQTSEGKTTWPAKVRVRILYQLIYMPPYLWLSKIDDKLDLVIHCSFLVLILALYPPLADIEL